MNPSISIEHAQRIPCKPRTPILPPEGVRCSVIILSLNGGGFTRRCVESVLQHGGSALAEIVLVDNGSDDPHELDWANCLSKVLLLRSDHNLGFAGGCNLGIRHAMPGNDIWLLNNDTIIFPGAMEALYNAFRDKDIGAAGSVSNYVRPTQKIYPRMSSLQELTDYYLRMPKDSQICYQEMRLSGFSMLIRNEAISDVGQLDTAFYPGGYEDDDYCLRLLEKGWKLVVCTGSIVYHYGSFTMARTSSVSEILLRNRRVFEDKWGTSEEDLFDDSGYYYLPPCKREPKSFLEIGTHGGAWLSSVLCRHPNSRAVAILRTTRVKSFIEPIIALADNLDDLQGKFDIIFCSDLSEGTYTPSFFSRLAQLLNEDGIICCRGTETRYLETLRIAKQPGYRLPALNPSYVETVCQMAGFSVSTFYRFIKRKKNMDITQVFELCLKQKEG